MSPSAVSGTVDQAMTLFARSPNAALSRSLRVIGSELRLEHDHEAAACLEHGEWGEGLLEDYQAYLDSLSSPRVETWPNLLGVAVELLAYNDRIVSEVRRDVLSPLRQTSRRRSRSGVRGDFLRYHRKLRDCTRRLEEAWERLGERAEPLTEYFRELELGSEWRSGVVGEPLALFRRCLDEFERELAAGDLRGLCQLSRRVRYVAERLENCTAHDPALLERARSLFRRALRLDGVNRGAGAKGREVSDRLERYRRNISRRLAVLESMSS